MTGFFSKNTKTIGAFQWGPTEVQGESKMDDLISILATVGSIWNSFPTEKLDTTERDKERKREKWMIYARVIWVEVET